MKLGRKRFKCFACQHWHSKHELQTEYFLSKQRGYLCRSCAQEVSSLAWKDTKFGRFRKTRFGTEVVYMNEEQLKAREALLDKEIEELLKPIEL